MQTQLWLALGLGRWVLCCANDSPSIEFTGIYNPKINLYGINFGTTPGSGRQGKIPDIQYYLTRPTQIRDLDGDGLSDFAERVIGTDLNNTDTDGDGIDDFTEVQQGRSD